jgi:DNA-binding GntR family transcriptional regulator
VVKADADLVREAFPILSALEVAAVELTAPRLKAALPRLRELNQRLSRETNKPRQYELDHGFHAVLTERCGNQRLLGLLEVERARARLFDGAYRRGTADRDGSCAEHEKIIRAIARGEPGDAARILQQHWMHGESKVIRWLSAT